MGGCESLAGLMPIHLYLKKLAKRSTLRIATLLKNHVLRSLFTACDSKGVPPHPHSLALMTNHQCLKVTGALSDMSAGLANITKIFDATANVARPSFCLMDLYPDRITFNELPRLIDDNQGQYIDDFKSMHWAASNTPNTIIVVCSSVLSNDIPQTTAAANFNRDGQLIAFIKALPGCITAPDAQLLVVRFGITRALTLGAEHIILITNSAHAVRSTVNPSVHEPPPIQILPVNPVPQQNWLPKQALRPVQTFSPELSITQSILKYYNQTSQEGEKRQIKLHPQDLQEEAEKVEVEEEDLQTQIQTHQIQDIF
ncbi:hypothetical protein NP233_g72 [Leucocoprinus birnbaumii]|uniref:Uncharacterized protein n=1 Tax=Leucocoprinus birnbaumii TaxID=56174 RepID=A0AAD5Z0H3_9AGAR|nr:hypothetical protein NP233_g72 [Leucocoprinus birnbaumii]